MLSVTFWHYSLRRFWSFWTFLVSWEMVPISSLYIFLSLRFLLSFSANCLLYSFYSLHKLTQTSRIFFSPEGPSNWPSPINICAAAFTNWTSPFTSSIEILAALCGLVSVDEFWASEFWFYEIPALTRDSEWFEVPSIGEQVLYFKIK